MNGKKKCKLLKQIRREIAQNNDIQYVTSECKFQGECTGTCPKCEAEVRYLEQELEKRRLAGKAVAVAGVAVALVLSSTGCMPDELPPTNPTEESTLVNILPGAVIAPECTESWDDEDLAGVPPVAETEEEMVLMGDLQPPDQPWWEWAD